MIEVKLSNGVAFLKEKFTRKMRKQIIKLMFSGVQIDADGKAAGLSLEAKAAADDYTVSEMVATLTVDGNTHNYPIPTSVFDDLVSKDFDLLVGAIEEVSKKDSESPKE